MANAKPKGAVGTPDDVEDIMGMFLMAFGEGVDGPHVHRATVRKIRATFIPSISKVVLKDPHWNDYWKAESATVLGWMLSVGRLAAEIAMEPKDRRTVIAPDDFVEALKTVIEEHVKLGRLPGAHMLGKWCT